MGYVLIALVDGTLALDNRHEASGEEAEPTGEGRREETVTKLTALILGVAAWAAVAGLAVVIAFNMGSKNQVLMFLPILIGVVVAWGIGEVVTEHVFNGTKEGA